MNYFLKTDSVPGDEETSFTFQKMRITQAMFFDHRAIQIGIKTEDNSQTKYLKRFKNTVLNYSWAETIKIILILGI